MPFVSYVGTIDSASVNPDGSFNESEELILDAIPTGLLARYSEQLERIQETGLDENEDVGFLLLRIKPNQCAFRFEASTYFQITVTGDRQDGEDWVESRSLQFGENDGENLPFYVRFEELLPENHLVETLEVISKFSHLPDMGIEEQATFAMGYHR